ncbi:zinc knuckle CX2CX4HX4C containing protein [Tanacetum coccineum]
MEEFGDLNVEGIADSLDCMKEKDLGNVFVSQPRMPIRVLRNPNLETMSDGNVHMQSSNEDKTVKITGVPLNTLGDIDNLTKAIDLGKLEVWSDLPSEKCTEVMETIWAMWEAFLSENSNATTGYSPNSSKSDVVAEFFDVSLITLKEIDDFTKDLELGKYAVWLEMTRDTCKEVMDNISTSDVLPNDPIVQSVDIHEKPRSYVGAAGGSKPELSKSKANFRSLFSKNLCEGANVSIPRKAVETVSTRFSNSLYGYFIGKRIAFPVVEYYVRNNWGLEDVLENGPWMTCNSPIILKKWSMNTLLCKEELTCIPVWVKIHDVPIQVFSEDGLSIIASHIDSLTLDVPLIEGLGYTIETVTIEYEWKPPRCDLCKIFGHIHDHFPKKVSSPPTIVTSNVVTPTIEKTNDGFQMVGKRRRRVNPSLLMVVNLVVPQLNKLLVTSTKKGNITMSNSYSALNDEDDEEVENVYDESANIF